MGLAWVRASDAILKIRSGISSISDISCFFQNHQHVLGRTQARRTVLSLTLNKRAISEIARCSSSRIRRTSSFWAAVRAGGLPPIRPRLRADANPSLVRSEILSRSNWAIDAKTWKTRRPAGVVVSMSSATPPYLIVGLL